MSRLAKLVNAVKESNLDALLLTGEENIHYATHFPALEGMVLILKSGEAVCFTDSRYIESATNVMAPQGYRVVEPEGSYPTPGTIRDFVAQRGIRTLGYENCTMTVKDYHTYRAVLPCELLPFDDGVEALRQIKEDEEIAWIAEAQRIAEAALEKLLPDIRPGAYEDELAAKLEYHMTMMGSNRPCMGMVLVSGAKTSMPHGVASHRAIEAGDFVTIDYGANIRGYLSDMTRTFAVGYATEKMREVYEIVLEAQQAGIDAFAAGRTGIEVDWAARSVIEKAGYGPCFGHGLGHSLGLNIHENPRANRTYQGRFVERNVITVEPGIYIPGEFGVRIEDMVYLSPEGKVNLTRFPKELRVLG